MTKPESKVLISASDIKVLELAAQDVIDGRDFEQIRPKVEGVAANARDDWLRAKICRSPIAAAICHIIGTRSLFKTELGLNPPVPPTATVYEQFMAATLAVDELAGEEIFTELPSYGPSFTNAMSYHSVQLRAVIDFEVRHPEVARRASKVPISPELINNSAKIETAPIDHVTVNAAGNSADLIVREGIRICLTEGELPPTDVLVQKIRNRIPNMINMTKLPGQFFITQSLGRKLATKFRQHIIAESYLDIPKWPEILRQVVESGSVSEFSVIERLQDYKAEHARIASARMFGMCAAKFSLAPTDAFYATNYFASKGIALQAGKFKLVTYQLHRNLDVAAVTFFADPQYRSAIQVIANSLRQAV